MKKKAHIRKDGSPSYKQEIRINGRRITKRFTRISDTEKWYSEMKRQKELVESGLTLSIDSEMTLNEYAEIWMEKRRSQGKPLGSWMTDRERLHKWVLPVFGERLLQSIGSQELESFMDRLVTKEGLSSTIRNRVRAVLHKLYNDAKRQGYVQVNPVSNVMLWKENREGFDYWHSLEECQAYLIHAELESDSFYVFAMLALNTGARLGEILALQNQDIDLENRRIHICKLKEYRNGEICKRTKGGVDRWLGINDEVFEVLSKHRLGFGKLKDFLVHQNGESMDARVVRSIHWRVCKKAGLPKIRIHDLRHTFASHYVMNGGSLHDLQALLGHSSPIMTQRYAHLAPGYLEKKASVVRIGKRSENVAVLRVAE